MKAKTVLPAVAMTAVSMVLTLAVVVIWLGTAVPWPVGWAGPAKPFCSMLARRSEGCAATPPSTIAILSLPRPGTAPASAAPAAGRSAPPAGS